MDSAPSLGAPKPTGPAEVSGQGTVTPHNVGAALDIRYHTSGPGGAAARAFGYALLTMFIRHRKALGWGFMAYNNMEFSQARPKVASYDPAKPDNSHIDHIHIDWVDYAKSKRVNTLGYNYIDEQGAARNKPASHGQWVSMSTNAAADSAALPPEFVLQFQARCAMVAWGTFDDEKTTRGDLSAAYHSAVNDFDNAWLYGWWSVVDTKQYYYYFDRDGSVGYTQVKPVNLSKPILQPKNRGFYFVSLGQVTVSWVPVGGDATEEVFSGLRTDSMSGASNRFGPLTADRMT